MYIYFFFYRRAKDHEKFAQFAANVYETIKGLTLLSSLYVVSAEAYMDICLKAVQSDSFSASEEKEESNSLIEKRYASKYNSDHKIINIKCII